MKQLLQNHGEIESKISDFSHDASATLAQIEVLYANIAYPLDATLCHSDGLPHATIAGHFVNLREHAREAEETLRKLADEHEACISAEDTTLKEMSRAMDGSGQESKADSAVDQRKMEAFKKEALAIAADKNQVLEEIDTVSRAADRTQLEADRKTGIQTEPAGGDDENDAVGHGRLIDTVCTV